VSATSRKSKTASAEARHTRALEIEKRLSRAMPEPRTELNHRNAWQLLIATILSAQSTDRTVNRVTPILFEHYPDPAALSGAPPDDVEALIKPTGFFRNKTKSIQAASRQLVERHAGEVPRSIEEMVELSGVARKTANVVLGSAYGIASGIVVDTHVTRVAARLGLSEQTDPVKIETDLCELFPRTSWVDMGHRFVLHGRYLCLARKPRCAECPLAEICPAAEAAGSGDWAARADREHQALEAAIRAAQP
jgi:endonuclease-3